MKWMRDGSAYLGAAGLLGLCTAAMFMAGCNKKDGAPTAATIDDLKYPGLLTIQDLGNGKAQLTWTAANNEKEFVGFNIYGIKTTSGDDSSAAHSDLGVTEGQAIQLLGDDNKPSADAIALLNKFDYDPSSATPFEKAGTPPAAAAPTATNSSGTTTTDVPAISARPIATLGSDGKPIYPSCQVSGTACTLTAQAAAATPTPANGAVTFDLSTLADKKGLLTVGETYCFFILSTMKGATQVSAVTSNVACITPQYETKFSYTLPATLVPGTVKSSTLFNLLTWQAACTSGTCVDPTKSTPAYIVSDNAASGTGFHAATENGPLYFESPSSPGHGVTIVAGRYSGIADLGYLEGGFADDNLIAAAPTFSVDTTGITTGAINGKGYSLPGQSIPLLAHHMYVIATADGAATTVPTTFFYNWLYVDSDTTDVAPGATAALVMRLPAAAK